MVKKFDLAEKLSYEQLHKQWQEQWQRHRELSDIHKKRQAATRVYCLDEDSMGYWQEAQFLRTAKLAVEVLENWNDGGIVSKLESLQSHPSFASASWYPEFISAAKDYFQSGRVPAAAKKIEDTVGTLGFIPIYGNYLHTLTMQYVYLTDPHDGRRTKHLDLKLDAKSQPQIYNGKSGRLVSLERFANEAQTHFMKFVAEELGFPPMVKGFEKAMVSYCKDLSSSDTFLTLVKALHFSLPIHTFGGDVSFKPKIGQEGFELFKFYNERPRSEETVRGEQWWV